MNEALDNSLQEQPVFDDSIFNDTIQHNELLDALLEQVGEVDYMAEANPNNADNFKLTKKNYVVTTIEKILELADANKWSLCIHNGFAYVYNGEYWKVIENDSLKLFLGKAAEKMGVPFFDARYFEFRDKLLKQFQTRANLPAPDADPDKVFINLSNGTLEISKSGVELRAFDPSDFLTYQLPFDYDPQATAPLFEKYLNRVQPDIERQKVLAEYLGYLFIRNGSGLKLEKVLVLYGRGANGKSVFFEVVSALLGSDNVSNYTLQSLTNENGYYRAKIADKLVNYASEINGRLGTDYFKQLVSGEPVEARLPYGEPFKMTTYAKLIFNCNELPKEVEQSNAFFRRFLIVPFEETIPPAEQDKELYKKITNNELSGVLNWVLEGLDRLLKQRDFTPCEAVERAGEKYRTESDSVKMFLYESSYQPSISNDITLQAMFSEYEEFCRTNGFMRCNIRTFSERLGDAGFHKERRSYGRIVFAEKMDSGQQDIEEQLPW